MLLLCYIIAIYHSIVLKFVFIANYVHLFSIWELLMDLTSNGGKTVIITTHYIEEAKQSQMVWLKYGSVLLFYCYNNHKFLENGFQIGLMRKGTLLSEATPTELLTSCNCTTLEDAFLKICQNHVAKTNSFKIPVKQVRTR